MKTLLINAKDFLPLEVNRLININRVVFDNPFKKGDGLIIRITSYNKDEDGYTERTDERILYFGEYMSIFDVRYNLAPINNFTIYAQDISVKLLLDPIDIDRTAMLFYTTN